MRARVARVALPLAALAALVAFAPACPTPAGDACNSDADCKKLELCVNGVCVDETGGEGEGAAGEGEGVAGEGEGVAGEGEGVAGEGEGEGAAAEGEGEGGAPLVVVVRDEPGGGVAAVPLGFTFSDASAQAESQPAHCSLLPDGGGSSLHFGCDQGALGDVALDIALTGAPTADLRVVVRAVPGDWLDVGRARRTLVTFDQARLPPGGVTLGPDVIHVPASVAPPAAFSAASLPELLDDGGAALALDLDDDGGFTNLASGIDHAWLYDVPAAGAQGGLVAPDNGDYSAMFHFGASIVAPLVDAVDSGVTLTGSSTPVPEAASGAGVSLAGAPLAAVALEDLVTSDAGTLSAWLSSSSTLPLAAPAIVVTAADGSSVEEHDGTHADEPSIFVDVDGSACGFSGAESSGQALCASPSPLFDGGWHLITFTWGAAGETLYVDGAFARASTRSSSASFTAHSLAIGGALDGARGFTGAVDEVRIANTVLDARSVALAFQSTTNPLAAPPAPARRFSEAFHLAGVVTFVVDGNAATPDVTLVPSSSTPLPAELVANEPVTLVAMAAMPSTTLARMTSALGVSFPSSADFDQVSTDLAANVVTSSASGNLDVAAPIVLHDVARDGTDTTPAARSVAVALAIFAGAPSAATRNLGATNSAGPLTTDATIGALQLFAVASTRPPAGPSAPPAPAPASLSAGGDRLATLATNDGGAELDVISLPADALVSRTSVSLPNGGEGAWAGYGLGP